LQHSISIFLSSAQVCFLKDCWENFAFFDNFSKTVKTKYFVLSQKKSIAFFRLTATSWTQTWVELEKSRIWV